MNEAEAANVDLFECIVLSALMNGADALPVSADDFGSSPTSPNRIIFNRISGMSNRNLLAVTNLLRHTKELENVGGEHRITEISLLAHDQQTLEYALANMLEHSRARQAAKIGQQLQSGGITPEQAREKLNEILSREGRDGDTLSVFTPDEISALPKIPNACLLDDNVIQKGGSTVIAGPPGIGKTKLTLQLIVAKNTGRDWCGLVSHGPPIEWIYLQNENGRDRLERDLQALRKWAPDFDQSKLHIQVYQTDKDGFLCLDDPEAAARIKRTVQKFPSAEGIVADPLRDFGIGNLDSDADMTATVRALAEIVRAGNPARVVIPVHHALTGRAGAIKASGLERSSFARNSKALLGWARAQINVSPGKEDSNEILLISCGKNNDGKEFPRAAVRLNPDTMIYEVDPDFDFEAWDEQLTAARKKKKPFTVEMVRELVKFSGELEIGSLAQLIKDKTGCGRARSYELVHEARKAKIFRYNRMIDTYAKN